MRDKIDISSNDNALFVTSQCNNRCVMCCQPPLQRNDLDGYFRRNMELIDSAPPELPSLGITGGEPTLLGDRLFDMIRHIKTKLPNTEIHLLTNGRAFADKTHARKLAACGVEKMLLGIPLHADNAADHDAITQARGSFNETMLGLYNLGRYDVGIELRVVLTRMNYRRLPKLPNFIYRNLPFVEFISLMGLEYTGYTIKNSDAVWIDPLDYRAELMQAVTELHDWSMDVSVFNLPRCVLPKSLWPFARKSISDWKTKYLDICSDCTEQAECCGLFATSRVQSRGVKPIIK
ncbi:His-Xaa-Ser system radical SAM maturase HxsC [uncultured Alistipes sp.]|uniref:His-Xaa-Ser system radical SAM maturase HxsC n=1 Tax=Alistipes sp. TaxID=1872444 RepID=UPI0025924518|nr:His-Xaa-Ser system radical SAM maturase HxsC [uncultured Alistipes sp.]